MSGIAILRGFLLFIEVLSAFLLVVLILMQKSKSQGMGLAFGGSMGESLFGAQMGNVLTKATVILAAVFMINTTLLAMIGPGGGGSTSIADSIAIEQPLGQPMQQQGQMPLVQPGESVMPEMPLVQPVEGATTEVPFPTTQTQRPADGVMPTVE